jgi:acyl transferase domain-containing protein
VVAAGPPVMAAVDLAALQQRCPRRIESAALYQRLAAAGLAYGACFQSLHEVRAGDGEVLAHVQLPSEVADQSVYRLAPMLLDGALQALTVLAADSGEEIYLPVAMERIALHGAIGASVLAHGRLRHAGG